MTSSMIQQAASPLGMEVELPDFAAYPMYI